MEELSIEEKAARYDEALRVLHKYDGANIMFSQSLKEEMFPELKESEDEVIIGALKSGLKLLESEYKLKGLGGIKFKKILAWLEKQGKENYEFPLAHEKMETERWKEACKAACSDRNYRSHYGLTETRDDYFVDGVHWADENPKQKTINKVEPKFKVGDWVVTTFGKVNQVAAIDYDCDGFTLDDGTYFSGSWKDNYHLWTIKDAKDGDVLCCESGWTCIFNASDNHTNTFSSYCFMDKSKWFCNTGCKCHSLNEAFIKAYNGEIHPATKEQCDKLEKVMTDAGYTFDFESKELKKIEQNSAWSEEDEKKR